MIYVWIVEAEVVPYLEERENDELREKLYETKEI